MCGSLLRLAQGVHTWPSGLPVGRRAASNGHEMAKELVVQTLATHLLKLFLRGSVEED